MSFLLSNMRALAAAAAPMTGQRATGAVQLWASTGTVDIPIGTYAIPAVGASGSTGLALDPQRAVKIVGTGAVGVTGALLPFTSNMGGARHNFPPGTPFVMSPPVPGLTGTARAPSGFVGGADPQGFGAVRDFVLMEALDGPALHVDLQRSGIKRFPGVLLAWQELMPADGNTQPSINRGNRTGEGKSQFSIVYSLHVVCDRSDNSHTRRHEAFDVLCTLIKLLSDVHAVDHERVSSPGGVQISRASPDRKLPQAYYQKFIVYTVVLSTTVALTRTDSRSYAEWLLTRLRADKMIDQTVQGGDLRIVNDYLIDMRPGDLDVGGEQVQVGGADVVE